jgi:hypothetical protein
VTTLVLDEQGAAASPEGLVLDRRLALGGELYGTDERVTGELSLGPTEATIDLQVRYGEVDVQLDGIVVTPTGRATLRGLVLPLDDIFGACPLPASGTIEVEAPDGVAVVRPVGDGEVESAYLERVSDRTAWCAWAPTWW